jgi:hypothetical protein
LNANKKAARVGRLGGFEKRRLFLFRAGGFHAGELGLECGLFAFDLFLATGRFDGFVVLFSHKCLYFVRDLRFRVGTMNFSAGRFNLYLLLLGALLAGGCATGKHSDKQTAALRVHLQSTESISASQTVTVLRSQPLLVPIVVDPILTESHVASASVLETPGGFAVDIQFNQTGTWMLEQYTGANPGKHLAIFGQWSDKAADGRWLAAPVISHRLANGLLSFTPDASRTEAEQFVKGLNHAAKKIRKQLLK